MNPETVVAALHMLVKQKSSVPKVAEAIGMNYYSLRDNMTGKSDIRFSTVLKVLDAIDVSWEQLMQVADALPESALPNSQR